eukprot:GHVQ01012953.1.p1 GENE.GHVQ01012953.1~~GHVQ01012953.1.p1  ORF type:complete len:613 (-),score=75.40 GHVQ01012953.1:1485-3323(-)
MREMEHAPTSSLPPNAPMSTFPSTGGPEIFPVATAPSLPPSGAVREDQIANAVRFLSHPSVRNAAPSKKHEFLANKGLTQLEINEAFRRTFPGEQQLTSRSQQAPVVAESLPVESTALQPFPPTQPNSGNGPLVYYGPPQPNMSNHGVPFAYGPSYPYSSPFPSISPTGGWGWFRGWLVPVLVSVGFAGLISQIWSRYTEWKSSRALADDAGHRAATATSSRSRHGTQRRRLGDANRSTGRYVEASDSEEVCSELACDEIQVGDNRSKRMAYESISETSHRSTNPLSHGRESSTAAVISKELHSFKAEMTNVINEQKQHLNTISDMMKDLIKQNAGSGGREPQPLATAETYINAWSTSYKDESFKSCSEPPGRHDRSEQINGTGHRRLEASTDSERRVIIQDDDANQRSDILALTRSIVMAGEQSNGNADVKKPLATLLLMIKNLLQNPHSDKYRKVNSLTPRMKERFGSSLPLAFELLEYLGFQKQGNVYTFMGSDLSPIETAFNVIGEVLTQQGPSSQGCAPSLYRRVETQSRSQRPVCSVNGGESVQTARHQTEIQEYYAVADRNGGGAGTQLCLLSESTSASVTDPDHRTACQREECLDSHPTVGECA